jgi:DnaA-homolog protein
LHGPHGVGKTHLLQAVCAASGERGAPAAFLPLPELVDTDVTRVSGFGELSFVCLDGIDSVAGNGAWERALFNLYRELDERRGRLIVAAGAAPTAVPYALRDLASRLNASLVLALQPLEENEQLRALQLRARLRGFELPDESAQYLLRRLPRDMASLCAFLDQLDEASLIAQRRLTVPFVREVMDRRSH